MPQVAYRVTRSRRKFVEAPKVKRMLGDAIDAEVKPHYVKEFEKIVANWEHKPEFKSRKFIKTDSISVDVFPAGEDKKYWIWTSGGTKKHDIPVGARGFLAFQIGYRPKTTPYGTYGGPGTASGDWVFTRKTVKHPGTSARNFEKQIKRENKQWFSSTMENIWRRTIRAL